MDHATVQRWVYKFTPLIEEAFRKRKKIVTSSWRMDETYIKVKGCGHSCIELLIGRKYGRFSINKKEK